MRYFAEIEFSCFITHIKKKASMTLISPFNKTDLAIVVFILEGV